jgi:hypothetical protein
MIPPKAIERVCSWFCTVSSAVFHSIWNIKPRLLDHGRFANPRDTTRYRCGLRLALTQNASLLFVPSRAKHCTRLARRGRERFLLCPDGAHEPRARRNIILIAAALLWTPSWAQYSVRDDLQRSVSFDKPPQRVISLLPSLTESVCALNECQRLVATDRYSNWPASVSALPKAGGLEDTQVELIVSLRPDVVLLERSARVTERLAQLGIKTFVIEPRNRSWPRPSGQHCGVLARRDNAAGSCPQGGATPPARRGAAQSGA